MTTNSQSPQLLSSSPAGIRNEIEALVAGHLLGPEGGDHEEIPTSSQVRDWYLLGMLAPQGHEAPREQSDKYSVDTNDDGDDEETSAPTLFASSLGFTVAVDRRAEEIVVDAHWGRYEQTKAEPANPDDETRTVWQRTPCGDSVTLPLAAGPVDSIAVTSDHPDVVVRGMIRDHADAWVVTLFLINGQTPQARRRDEVWLFQAELSVTSTDGSSIFIRPERHGTDAADDEAAALDMLYRNEVEFATGHGTAVHATVDPEDVTRARRIATTAIPTYEVPQTRAPTPSDLPAMADAVFDMDGLADAPDLRQALEPLAVAYEAWIEQRTDDLTNGIDSLSDHQPAGAAALDRCREAAGRIRRGIDLLERDPDAERAFRFANRAMARQRLHTIAAEIRSNDDSHRLADVLASIDEPHNRSWRPFQLAFVLINLESLTDPTHEERALPGVVDLLWFPTGGGKTEAYLGLCAYTLAIRRLQGVVDGHDGRDGVAIVMRYTLRLLTAQQFQRAAALLCACETLRREAIERGDNPWGDVPYRIGLWVGFNVTPNQGEAAERAIDDAKDRKGWVSGTNPLQLTNCPWCGNELKLHLDVDYDRVRRRTIVYCSDKYGRCAFGEKHAKGEGLPVVSVDDELYRLLPGLIIATADKFAQLPWQGQLTALFGRVTQRCERHGYRSGDLDDIIDEADSHRARAPHPSAKTVTTLPLRPPDLIIQDELHLMTGPLGTLAGLYETVVDNLCTWTVDGTEVRPKVVASTATVRRAADQARFLFNRGLSVFPPHGLDAADSFFARQVPVSEENPGRRYLGICAQGRRIKAIEIRMYVALMASAQFVYDRYGKDVDPWMTLVGYFSSLRDLGGMRRLVDDDVKSRLARIDQRGLGRRYMNEVAELTSRMSSSQIPATLRHLAQTFDPSVTDGPKPIDVLLATNMISVGVDVPRLGLMVVGGQPKSTAEYIQATSRVGRSAAGPGLVYTISNWARPRDLSHFERFEHFHATFYRHVEATTLTPFAPRALDRGLTGVLTGMIRHRVPDWNPNPTAQDVDVDASIIEEITDLITTRAEQVTDDPAVAELVENEIETRLQRWSVRVAQRQTGQLGYKERRDGATAGLLRQPSAEPWSYFTCPNSLREVEPGINLLFDDVDYGMAAEPDYSYPNDGVSPSDGTD